MAQENGKLSPAVVKKRSDAAWVLADKWRSIREEAYELAFAGINPYAADKASPRVMMSQFDSTAVTSTIRTVGRVSADMMPPDQDWIMLEPGPLLEIEMADNQEALTHLKNQLGDVSKVGNMVINSGAAVDARTAALLDAYIAGAGYVLAMEDPEDDVEPISEQAVSQAEVAIEEDGKGRICGLYRRRKIKIRNITGVWDDARVPSDLAGRADEDSDPEIEVLEATYRDNTAKKWRYEVFYCDGKKNVTPLVEREYDVNPWSVFRWMKLPGIPYGPGPVILALADIRTVNKVMEMLLKNAALALAGMYLVRDDGVVNMNNIIITQGGMIPVQSTGGSALGASIVPLTTNREFNLGQIVLEQLQMSIKKQLFDATLPPDRGTPATATEMIQRIRELTQDFGLSIGRLDADVVQYVRRRLEILANRGMIPRLKVDQFTFKIRIKSPLARASQLQAVEQIIQFYEIVARLAGPEAAAIAVKLEQVIVFIAEKMGISTDLYRSAGEQEEEKNRMLQLAAAASAGQSGGTDLVAQAAPQMIAA